MREKGWNDLRRRRRRGIIAWSAEIAATEQAEKKGFVVNSLYARLAVTSAR